MTEWQCPECHNWHSMNVAKCVHVKLRHPSLNEMIAARDAGRDGDALNLVGETTDIVWQPHFKRRTVPDAQGT